MPIPNTFGMAVVAERELSDGPVLVACGIAG
jgi:hypothetical protein